MSLLASILNRIVGLPICQVVNGTQFNRPIADPEHVDERRASVGLGPLAEYLAQYTEIRKMLKK